MLSEQGCYLQGMDRGRRFPNAVIDSWLEREIASCLFDVRHDKHLGVRSSDGKLLSTLSNESKTECQLW